MSGRYLTDLPAWLRAAGLNVVEYSGWQTRARSSGGYASGRPWGVMWHHTASSTTPQNDANYMCNGSPDRPVANLLIARDGSVWVLAAGATNTNGKGGPCNWSRGQIPVDQMNTHAVGMEIANNGVGEAYPQAQIDAAFKTSVTIVQRLGLAASDVCQHYNWAPTRKIDPATAAGVQGPWRPGSCTGSGTWNQNDLIAEHQRRCGPTPPVPPTPDEDDMRLFDGVWKRNNDQAVYAIYSDASKVWQCDQNMLNATIALETINGASPDKLAVRVQNDPAMWRAFGLVKGPQPADGVRRDEYGERC